MSLHEQKPKDTMASSQRTPPPRALKPVNTFTKTDSVVSSPGASTDSTSIGSSPKERQQFLIDDSMTDTETSVDSVYEAKAQILNEAVRSTFCQLSAIRLIELDSRYRHGLVSMAALRCCWLWLG